jgi:hypothetical protein
VRAAATEASILGALDARSQLFHELGCETGNAWRYVVTQRTPVRATDLDRSRDDARSDSRTAVAVAA